MSYHIIISKSQNVTYGQMLTNKFVPNGVCVKGKFEPDNIVVGYNKFYLENESSRGVALTVDDYQYDVELNIGATTADYLLATKLALAIAHKSLQKSEGSLNNFHGINPHVIPKVGKFVARRGIEPLFPE